MQNIKIVDLINSSFASADSAYKARTPDSKPETQPDIKAGMMVFANFTPAQLTALEKLGVDWGKVGAGLGACTNVKIARRLPQLIGFVISGDGRYLKGSAQTAVLEYCALAIGAKTKEGLRFASTGKGDENTSDSVNISKARLLQKAFGKVGASSRDTQASVSFSKGGMLEILGLVTPWARGDTMPALVDCKLGRALSALINGATEGQITLWAEQSKARATK